MGQDPLIFHGRRGGVFVDIGAFDGAEFSNPWYWEQELAWNGLCVEPNPTVFARVIQNRKCTWVSSETRSIAGVKRIPPGLG